MAADIIKIDMTTNTDFVEGVVKMPMQINNYISNSPTLTAGTAEEIGGTLYIIDGGDVTPGGTPSSTSCYLGISEDGDGTATAGWISDAPTWDDSKGGWYYGTVKVIGRFLDEYDTGTYRFYHFTRRPTLRCIQGSIEFDLRVGDDLIVGDKLDVEGDFELDGDITLNNTPAIITGTTQFNDDATFEDYVKFDNNQTGGTAANIEFTQNTNFNLGLPCRTSHGNFTGNQLYTSLSSYIPNTGDKIRVTGAVKKDTENVLYVSHAINIGSSTIELRGLEDITWTSTAQQAASGGAADWDVSIAW